jgi:hypothetical protein
MSAEQTLKQVQTEWEMRTAEIRKHHPSVTWKEPVTPSQSLARALDGVVLKEVEK